MKKYLVSLLLIAFAISMIFTGIGCKVTTPTTAAAETTAASGTTAASNTVSEAKPTTLKIICWEGEKEIYAPVISKFSKIHPEVTVEITTTPFTDYTMALTLMYSQHQEPDIAMVDSVKTVASQGMVVDLNDKILAMPGFDVFSEGQLERMRYDGKYWGLHAAANFPILFYNIDLLKEAGVTTIPPKTWAELEDACQKILDANITKNGKSVIPYVFPSYKWFISPYVFQAGGEEMNADQTQVLIDSPQAIEGLTFAQNMIKKGYSIKPEAQIAQEVAGSFSSGWSALYVGGFWTAQGVMDAGINFDTTVLPGKTEELAATTIGGLEHVIFKTSKNQDLAWEFMQLYSMDPEVVMAQIPGGTSPGLRYLYEEPYYSKIVKEIPAFKYATTADYLSYDISHYSWLENFFWWPEGGNSWQAACDSILIDLKDPTTVLTELKAELQPKLDQWYAENK